MRNRVRSLLQFAKPAKLASGRAQVLPYFFSFFFLNTVQTVFSRFFLIISATTVTTIFYNFFFGFFLISLTSSSFCRVYVYIIKALVNSFYF